MIDQSMRIEKALAVAYRSGGVDGDHHKQWVIDQMVRALTGAGYDKWVEEYEGFDEETGERESVWERGVAP